MNGYVNGNNAYQYSGNCIEFERAQRWMAHRRAQLEQQAPAIPETERLQEKDRNRRLLVIEMVLRCATAILLLVPMCIKTLESWNVLWTEGFQGNLPELMMASAGIVLSMWILAQVSHRTEEIMDEIAPEAEEEDVGWR